MDHQIKVYLIYADLDPNEKYYRRAIAETPIIPLRCCNNGYKNLLRYNTSGMRIDRLPVFVCRQGNHRWLLTWSHLELAKKLAVQQ